MNHYRVVCELFKKLNQNWCLEHVIPKFCYSIRKVDLFRSSKSTVNVPSYSNCCYAFFISKNSASAVSMSKE